MQSTTFDDYVETLIKRYHTARSTLLRKPGEKGRTHQLFWMRSPGEQPLTLPITSGLGEIDSAQC